MNRAASVGSTQVLTTEKLRNVEHWFVTFESRWRRYAPEGQLGSDEFVTLRGLAMDGRNVELIIVNGLGILRIGEEIFHKPITANSHDAFDVAVGIR